MEKRALYTKEQEDGARARQLEIQAKEAKVKQLITDK